MIRIVLVKENKQLSALEVWIVIFCYNKNSRKSFIKSFRCVYQRRGMLYLSGRCVYLRQGMLYLSGRWVYLRPDSIYLYISLCDYSFCP